MELVWFYVGGLSGDLLSLCNITYFFVSGLTGLLAQRLSHYNPPALPFAFARK
jgi:hypothetical protein